MEDDLVDYILCPTHNTVSNQQSEGTILNYSQDNYMKLTFSHK